MIEIWYCLRCYQYESKGEFEECPICHNTNKERMYKVVIPFDDDEIYMVNSLLKYL